MKVLASSLCVFLLVLITGCTVPGSPPPDLTGNEAIVELRSAVIGHTDRPLSLKMASVDGAEPGQWGGFKKRFYLPPGRHTLKVTGEFEKIASTVTFTLNARPRQTYWIGGQFALQRGGYLRHSYTLQDSRGNVLARREVVPR